MRAIRVSGENRRLPFWCQKVTPGMEGLSTLLAQRSAGERIAGQIMQCMGLYVLAWWLSVLKLNFLCHDTWAMTQLAHCTACVGAAVCLPWRIACAADTA